MDEDDLRTFLDREEKDAIGYSWGTLQRERSLASDYYFAKPLGNEGGENSGRSDIVSTEVFDTVEWTLPQLIRIFASTDKIVEFEPQGQEDLEPSQQATDTCNYVFWRQNPGFLVLYSWFKDALIQKNGFVKWYWSKSTEKKRKKYRGLTIEMITQLLDDDGVEVVAQQSYPDPLVQMILNQRIAAMQAQGQPLPAQMPEIPLVYDVEIEVTQEAGKVCIEPVPPEEVVISRRHNSVILNDAPYVAHVCQKTLSELRIMGYEFDDDDPDIVQDSPTWLDTSSEKVSRLAHNEDGEFPSSPPESTDPSQRQVWVREAYCLVDFDGDGIAEKRRIIRAGNKIFENEPCEHVQMATITPIIITHRCIGMSWAEVVMDLQFLGSTIWRQMIDNLFHSNNQGHIVLGSSDGRVMANIDQLLDSRPGRVMTEYQPNAIRAEAVPWVAGQAFPMLEYIDQQRMNRSGTNYLSSGLQADAINKTARGAVLAQNMMQEKLELVARIFAEGVKELFKGILYMLSKYQTRPMMYRLRNKFVQYDPSDWKTQYDMSINVGLGTGNKDQQLMHLQTILQAQTSVGVALGIADKKNIFNTVSRMTENAGFKNAEEFWTDPENSPQQPQQPPPPDPVKMAEVQVKKYEADTNRFDAQTKRMAAMSQARLSGAEFQAENMHRARELFMEGLDMRMSQMPPPPDQAPIIQPLQQTGQAVAQLDQKIDAMMQQWLAGQQQILQVLSVIARPKSRVPTRDPRTREIVRVDEVATDELQGQAQGRIA